MRKVIVICPHCLAYNYFKNWFHWVFRTPFHFFGARRLKCPACEKTSYVKPMKKI